MKLNRSRGMLFAVIASVGMGTAVTAFAQSDTSSTSSSATAPHSMHHRGAGQHAGGPPMHSPLVGSTLQATKQLKLTAAQKSQIKTLLHNAHEQERANMASRPDMAVLGDPSNPGYSAAIASLKTNAANRIQSESDLQSQIVNVLTPDQKAKLPAILASLQAKHEARRTASAGHSSSGGMR